MKNAVIIGATSGIGRALAKTLDSNGYSVAITGRRGNILKEVQSELANKSFCKVMDVTDDKKAVKAFQELVRETGSVDLIILNAGVGEINDNLDWEIEKNMIDVNATGFAAMAVESMRYFEIQGSGHLVGISSISCLRGSRDAPAYGATKAFVSNYLEGLACRANHENKDIKITDIRPGFVDTPMTEGQEGMFWLISVEKAASHIFKAIRKRKRIAYIPKRWTLIAWILRKMPFWIYKRL